jgi:hypothetical protein
VDRYFDDDNEFENTKQQDLNNAKKAAEVLAKSGLQVEISSKEEEELIRYVIEEEIEFTE